MSRKKLEQLFVALQQFKEEADNDLSIHEPNEDDDLHFICCDQKIIHCEDDIFDISCLYQSHPTIEFATIPEVVEFYRGLFDATRFYKDFDTMTSLDMAYNLGIYCDMEYVMQNTIVTCLNKRLHKTQYKWHDTE